MKPEEFFLTATHLLQGKREGDWRSCISRAYYALYWLITEELLKTIPLLILQKSSLTVSKNHIGHDRLTTVLKHSSNPEIRQIGDRLEILRLSRVAQQTIGWTRPSRSISLPRFMIVRTP